jgi:hypothetical protein
VLKDILVAAGMAIAAGTFRGGRLVRDEPHPAADPDQATLVPVPGWRPRRSRAPQPDFELQ